MGTVRRVGKGDVDCGGEAIERTGDRGVANNIITGAGGGRKKNMQAEDESTPSLFGSDAWQEITETSAVEPRY